MKRKLIAAFEVIGILVIGWTLTRVLITVLGVPPLQDYLDKAMASEKPDFIYLSYVGFLTLFIQFLSLMIPAYLMTKLLHREGLKNFGIGKGNFTIGENILTGVILFCLLGIPMKLLLIANHFTGLGMVPTYWEIFNKEWNPGFWLFMAVGSYAVIPVFEELFYRGYAQYRFAKEFGFFTVLLISLLFVSAHFQYFIGDLFNLGMLFSLFILALGMAFARLVSASIIAPIAIHSLMNIPLKYPYDIFVLAAMMIFLGLLRKRAGKLLAEFINQLKKMELKVNLIFLFIIIGFALGMNFFPEITLIIFVFSFIVSLIIQIADKIKSRGKHPDTI